MDAYTYIVIYSIMYIIPAIRYTIYTFIIVLHGRPTMCRARGVNNRKKDFGLQPMNYYAAIINVIIL